MKYVCLLRGINVGGKTRVEMSRLKALFEGLGFEQVSTYINSGNVLFTSSYAPVQREVEAAIEKEFGFHVFALLIDERKFKGVSSAIDPSWSNDAVQKTDVMFLWPEIDDASILQKVSINSEVERAIYVPGALIWNIGRQYVTRSGAIKLVKTNDYKAMTVRNCNTVRKLAYTLS